MNDDNVPATRGDLRQLAATMASKEDLKAFATKEDLLKFATKDDLRTFEGSMREQFHFIHDDITRILNMLIFRDKRLDNHERRIKRLEKTTV